MTEIPIDRESVEALATDLSKRASIIFIAVESSVADDVSTYFKSAAATLRALSAARETDKTWIAELEAALQGVMDLAETGNRCAGIPGISDAAIARARAALKEPNP